jgi:hypothetical protein
VSSSKRSTPPKLQTPGDELKKVLNFKKKIQSERLIYYEESNEADFEDKIRRCVTRHLQTLIKEEVASQTPESGSRTVPKASEKLPAETILSAEGTRFVQELVSTPADTETVDAFAVAQLRLIAATIARPGNDEQTLGAHDANLLFKNREALVLGQREVEGLIDSGLEHHNSENVPLWYWHAQRNGFEWSLLPIRSIIGGPEIRVGALLAMRLIEEQLAGPPPITREHYLTSWLEETTPWNVKVAALGYLCFGVQF